MPYSITCSIKILTFAIAPFLFSSCRPLWMCYDAKGVHFTVPPRKKRCILLPGGTDVHIQQQIHLKKLKPLSFIILLCQDYCCIEKDTGNLCHDAYNQTSKYFEVPICFGFNESLWEIFSLLSFENFWISIWVVVVWRLILRHRLLYFKSHLTLMPMNKKLDCKNHQNYSKILRKICEKEV